jgi:hypothetical protein
VKGARPVSVPMDFREALAKCDEDGDDVAADNMRGAMRTQEENLQKFAISEREEWMSKLDVPYIKACSDVDELQRIYEAMDEEGFVGLKNEAEDRLKQLVK